MTKSLLYMRILLFIYTLVFLVACNSNQGFVIDGVITNAQNGEMICLSYPVKRDGIWYEQCDTTYIKDGHFRFEGKVDGVVPANLSFQNMDFAQLFIEPSEITFRAERSALYDYSLSGLSIDNELDEYREAFAEYDRAVYRKSYEAMRKNEEWVEADNAGSPNANELWSEFYALVLEHHEISSSWPDMAIKYIDSHHNQTIIPYLIDELICCNYDIATIESHINRLTDKQQCSPLGELMQIRYDIAKLNGGKVGSEALDYTLRSADGKQINLSECYAKGYVLLDFWASWCAPCINEIPKVRELHEEYGNKLQILSISVDRNEADWRDTVRKFHLVEWSQLIIDYPDNAENYYFKEQADMSIAYEIEQIPCFILINNNGTIVGRWSHLTPTAIEEINRLINSEEGQVLP